MSARRERVYMTHELIHPFGSRSRKVFGGGLQMASIPT